MSTESNFRHTQLDTSKCEIRLIKLQTDLDGDGRICIAMKQFELDTTTNSPILLKIVPSYFALSYTWGDTVSKATICISGALCHISKNLHECLMILRTQLSSHTYLWIDQLCVDQTNIQERNNQVQLMGDIYRRANKVIVWLGAASENSDRAISLIHNNVKLDEEKASTIKDILARPYWTRLWIIQEVILAREILIFCGSSMISWSRFQDFFKDSPLWWMGNSDPAGNLIRTRLEGRTPLLFEAILRFKTNGCKDPRDKIYGLMGFVGEANQIPIDYSKSASDVYADTFFVLIGWVGDYDQGTRKDVVKQLLELGNAMEVLSSAQLESLFVKLTSRRWPYIERSELDFYLS